MYKRPQHRYSCWSALRLRGHHHRTQSCPPRHAYGRRSAAPSVHGARRSASLAKQKLRVLSCPSVQRRAALGRLRPLRVHIALAGTLVLYLAMVVSPGSAMPANASPGTVVAQSQGPFTVDENTPLSEPAGTLEQGASDSTPNTSATCCTASLANAPAEGTVTVDSDGAFTYTPASGYMGTDSFTYTLTDSDGNVSAPATVSLTIACAPVITSVSAFAAGQTPDVTIEGSCFGTGNAFSGSDNPYFMVVDNTYPSEAAPPGDPNWQGCSSIGNGYGAAVVTCDVASWADTQITFSGYTGGYGSNYWVVNPGDAMSIYVWNAQTGTGPAVCNVTAGGGRTTCAPTTLPPSPPPPATNTITTPSANSIGLGESLTDTATVLGDVQDGPPQGTVDFYVCGPFTSPQLCSSTAQSAGSVPLATVYEDFSTATSGAFTPSAAGTYCFGAIYSPSSTYSSSSDNVSGTVDPKECVVVSTAAASPVSVTPVPDVTNPTIVIRGSGFGTEAADSGLLHQSADTPYFKLVDLTHKGLLGTAPWEAGGYDTKGNADGCKAIIGYWTNTEIILSPQVNGLTSCPLEGNDFLSIGDTLQVDIWPNGDTSSRPLQATTTVVAPGQTALINSVSPRYGPTSGGLPGDANGTVTVSGEDLAGAEAIWFGDYYATPPVSTASGNVTAVPPGQGNNAVDVEVATPEGTSGTCVLGVQVGCADAYYYMSGVLTGSGSSTQTVTVNVTCGASLNSKGTYSISCGVGAGGQALSGSAHSPNGDDFLDQRCLGAGPPEVSAGFQLSLRGSFNLTSTGEFGYSQADGLPAAVVADGTVSISDVKLQMSGQGSVDAGYMIPLVIAAPPIIACVDDVYVLLKAGVQAGGTVTLLSVPNAALEFQAHQDFVDPGAAGGELDMNASSPSVLCGDSPLTLQTLGNCLTGTAGAGSSGSANVGVSMSQELLFQVGPDDINVGAGIGAGEAFGFDGSLDPPSYVEVCASMEWQAGATLFGYDIRAGGPIPLIGGPYQLYGNSAGAAQYCPMGPVPPPPPPTPPAGAASSSSASSDAVDGTVSATNDSTTVAATGVGSFTLAQYNSDPVGAPSFVASGEYFDLDIAAGSYFRTVVITDCNLSGGTSLKWWDPTGNGGSGGWENIVGAPGPTYNAGPPACISVTLDNYTTPTLAQLTGTVFAVSSRRGYWLVSADGTVYELSGAAPYGSLRKDAAVPPHGLGGEVAGIASTPDGGGYWLVTAKGVVSSFGDATKFCPSSGCASLPVPASPESAGQVVGVAADPSGGYWLVSKNGTVHALSGATSYGSLSPGPPIPPASGMPPAGPQGQVVGIASTPDGDGYWLVSAEGVVWPFGDAENFCTDRTCASLPRSPRLGPAGQVVGVAADPSGGYWLVSKNGTVHALSGATSYGSLSPSRPARPAPGKTPTRPSRPPGPIVGIGSTANGGGYWVVSAGGVVSSFGDAEEFCSGSICTSVTALPPAGPARIVGIAVA